MMSEDVRKTIRLAVTLHRNISECALSLGYDDADIVKFQRAVEDSDHALAWLDALPQAPEPDWSQAPEWARWAVAAPFLGQWLWLETELEPEFQMDGFGWAWYPTSKWDMGPLVEIPLGIDWRTLKRQRPG